LACCWSDNNNVIQIQNSLQAYSLMVSIQETSYDFIKTILKRRVPVTENFKNNALAAKKCS
jgi:hypothetical protein